MKPLKIPKTVKPVWSAFKSLRKQHERDQAKMEKSLERARARFRQAKKILEVVEQHDRELQGRQSAESRATFQKLIAACAGTEVNAGQLMLTLTKTIPPTPKPE